MIHDESSSSDVLTSEPSLSESEFSALPWPKAIRFNDHAGSSVHRPATHADAVRAQVLSRTLSTDYWVLSSVDRTGRRVVNTTQRHPSEPRPTEYVGGGCRALLDALSGPSHVLAPKRSIARAKDSVE